jgi:hypothetical protein
MSRKSEPGSIGRVGSASALAFLIWVSRSISFTRIWLTKTSPSWMHRPEYGHSHSGYTKGATEMIGQDEKGMLIENQIYRDKDGKYYFMLSEVISETVKRMIFLSEPFDTIEGAIEIQKDYYVNCCKKEMN